MNGGGEEWDQLEGDLEKKVLSDVSDAHALCILYSFSSHSTSGLVNRHTKSKDRWKHSEWARKTSKEDWNEKN